MYSTFTRVCGCCGVTFTAKHAAAKWCSSRCGMRAYQRRRRGAPEADPGVIQLRQPQVLQPEILDDSDDLPLSWRQASPAPITALPTFAYDGRQVRVVTDEQGMPWFVAADVCAVLGMGNPTQALSRLDDDEKTLISNEGQGRREAPTMNAVNEFGLYSLILGSRKPEAKAFKRWVTHDVLPAIRRTGSYSTPTAQPQQLPEGVHVIAATRRRAAELWWEAIESEVHSALSRRLNPVRWTDAGLQTRTVRPYSWQQLSLTA